MGTFQLGIASRVGTKHSESEDSVLFDESLGSFIVADGMGGYKGGALASSAAVEVMREYLQSSLSGEGNARLPLAEYRRSVTEAIQAASYAIYTYSLGHPPLQGMGTTLTCLCFWGDDVVVGHVGDSRCYSFGGEDLVQITHDHVVESRSAGGRSVLARAVGVERAVEPDILTKPCIENEIHMLCSDGVHSTLRDTEIARILRKYFAVSDGMQAAADELARSARLHGSDDDISVILVRRTGHS